MVKKLNEITGMPKMSKAFSGWKANLIINKIVQSIDTSGFKISTKTALKKEGTLQPLSPELLETKPDGQRSWTWVQLHLETSTVDFKTDDIVEINNTQYKVMQVFDYHLNNYIEYHLILDYQT